MAYEQGAYSEKAVEQMLRTAGASLQMNQFCGVCGSPDLHFEHASTKFKTMREAEPELARIQAENLASRAAIEAIRKQARKN
jgi:hypothetical protein